MSIQDVTTKHPDAEAPERAAVYVRMSTENQKYSVANQLSSIGVYATARGIEIARDYEDHAKSGLTREPEERSPPGNWRAPFTDGQRPTKPISSVCDP